MDPLQNGLEDPGFQLVGAQHHRPGWLEPGQSPSTTLNPPPDAPCAPALMARPQGTGRGPRQDTANGYCRQLVIPCVARVRHRALDARGLPVSEAATRAFAATLGRNASKNVSFGPIEQRTTPGSVAHVLRTAILDGTLAPGSQLREIPLAADLGVSRAPLREALGILADEGLIVKYPYRGAFVAEVSATGMSEIASLRKRLEPYAIELAIPRLTGTSRIKVTRALEDMAFGADNNDLTATVDAHMAFHRAFYELSEHKLLLDLWKSWEAQLQMFFSADHQAFADLHDMVADHERLLSIIDRGDIDEITREIAVHVHSPSPAEVEAEATASADT